MKLFACYNDGMINLLGEYFWLSCDVHDVYKRKFFERKITM